MYRSSLRAAISARSNSQIQQIGRRFASTVPSRSGTFKGALARWGLAGAIVYYYNTSTVFADEPRYALFAPPETQHESETFSTVDAVAEQRRTQSQRRAEIEQQTATSKPPATPAAEPDVASEAGELEEEAQQQGAFNEETGEINWDCPCLGGMAHGVCGEQFRAAFSCFVYSKEEPKGVECIDRFKDMQNCFREHPDIYGSELDDEEAPPPDEEVDGVQTASPSAASVPVESESSPAQIKESSVAASEQASDRA